MRRIVPVVVATVGGLALLASFHATPGNANKSVAPLVLPTQPPAAGSPPTSTTSSAPSSSVPPGTVTTSPGGSVPPTSPPPTSPPPTSPPTTAAPTSRTINGPVVSNIYGDVQVQIVVSGGQLVDVEALQLPMDRRRSQEINDIAGPDLRQEVLQAKSANINVISGATYTSYSYAQSLQAALDQAGI